MLAMTGVRQVLMRACVSLVVWVCLVTPIAAADISDSTSARERSLPKPSVGDVLLSIPGEVARLPIYAVKLTTQGLILGSYETPLRRLLYLQNPIEPFYPVAGYSSRTGLMGGLGLKLKNIGGGVLKMKGAYSSHQYQDYKIGYRMRGEVNSFEIIARYRKLTQESFYGLGNDTDIDDETNFSQERTLIQVEGTRHLLGSLKATISGGFRATNISNGLATTSEGSIALISRRFSLSEDRFAPTRFVYTGGALTFDCRDHQGQPSRGLLVTVATDYYLGTGVSDDIDVWVSRGDASAYLNLFRKRILAVRVQAQTVEFSGERTVVPFYLLSSLGGADDLRGYFRYRFLGEDMAMGTVEYRYPIWDVVDAFLFVDAGQVYEDIFTDFYKDDFNYDYGGGLRIFNAEGITFGMQVALSDEPTRFYFELGADW